MNKKTYYIKTFGCQMNIRDSEIMSQKLNEDGYGEVSAPEDASLIILNTCSVREKAAQKVFSLLGSLRPLKRDNPRIKICVSGCVAQQEGEQILERMPHVDLVLGTQAIYDLPALLRQIDQTGSGKVAVNLSDSYEIPRYIPRFSTVGTEEPGALSTATSFSRFVTIMQGCNNFCTYCVVPYTRGREVSRSTVDIIDEVHTLVKSGAREIILLGQNVNSYGRTNPVTDGTLPYSFPDLLRDVAQIDGLKRLRFTTSNPKDLSDGLIRCFADIKNLCPQFHLPVQSGSDNILKKMNRKYQISDYLKKVALLREARPDIALTTDIIVGFPGETERDFQSTMDLLEQVRFHGSFSFKYSDRPGTVAQRMPDKCDEETKARRLQDFQKRQDEISAERNCEYIGQFREVLIEQITDSQASGRLSTNHLIHFDSWPETVRPGDFVFAEIVQAGKHSLKGLIC